MRRVRSSSILPFPSLTGRKSDRKRRRRRWRRRARLPLDTLRAIILTSRWISLLLVVLCVGALAVIGLDEGFYLSVIPVQGVSAIPAQEVVQASGLAGAHIFGAQPHQAADQITEIPGVSSATVALEWPNKAEIKVQEESPVAIWEQGGQQFWVSRNGEMAPARVDLPGLLHIQSVDPLPEIAAAETEAGAEGEAEAEAASEAASEEAAVPLLFVAEDVLQGALQLRRLHPELDMLTYEGARGLSYEDERGWRVYLGTGTDMARKVVLYEGIVGILLERGETPVYISVSNPAKPYYFAE